MSESPRDQILRLRAEIQRHEELYRKKHAPEISDFEYDKLVDQLADLEREFPMFAGPDLGIGDDKSEGFQQADHKAPMLSLDNTYDEADFRAFGDRLYKALGGTGLEFIVEPKVDGVAVSLTFEKGQFVRAVTRGNGARGDDVTANVSLIREIPRTLKGAPDLLEVRGEIYMELAEFQRLNQLREAEGEPLYANPRNLAAGTVKLLDGEEARRRRLSIVCYGLGACEPASAFPSLKEFKTKLKAWGFPIRDDIDVQQGVDAAWKAIQQLDVLRRNLPFPTDGAVVKVNRLEDQLRAGTTSKFPHWAVAFKFPPDQAETILRTISMQVGRTGAITPVAELDPVLLAGSTVARATLHNADEIARKDIREGDTVRIQKAGEIIPQVLAIVLAKRPADAQPFDFEGRLKELGLDATREGKEAAYKLRTPSRDMKVRRLVHFASKQCLDIDGLGDAVAEQLVDLGLVNVPVDALGITPPQWRMLEGFKDKSVDNMMAGIEQAKQRELWRAIHALGIPNVGMQTAKDLARHFKSMDTVMNLGIMDLYIEEPFVEGKIYDDVKSVIKGIGPENAKTLSHLAQNSEFRDRLNTAINKDPEPLDYIKDYLESIDESNLESNILNIVSRLDQQALLIDQEIGYLISKDPRLKKKESHYLDLILDIIKKHLPAIVGNLPKSRSTAHALREAAGDSFFVERRIIKAVRDSELTVEKILNYTPKNYLRGTKAAIPGVTGPVIARSISTFNSQPENRADMKKLHDWLKLTQTEKSGDALTGLTFVSTGETPGMDREQLRELIEKNGGKMTGSVTKKTSYLIAEEPSGSSKYLEAVKLGVKIIKLEELNRIING